MIVGTLLLLLTIGRLYHDSGLASVEVTGAQPVLDYSLETVYQAADLAFCLPPDKPGRKSYSGASPTAVERMYQFHVLRPMIPLQAGLSEKQVQ